MSVVGYNMNFEKLYKNGVLLGGSNELNGNIELIVCVKYYVKFGNLNVIIDVVISFGLGLDLYIMVENVLK